MTVTDGSGFNRRTFIRGAAALTAAGPLTALTACGGGQNGGQGATSLTIGVAEDIKTLDIPTGDPGVIGLLVCNQTTDALINRDRNYRELVPGLAVDMPTQIGDLSYEFRVRDDVVFHDGTPMTARDIEFSMGEVLNNPKSWDRALWNRYVKTVTAPDDRTVRIVLKRPWPFMNAWIGNLETMTVNRDVYEQPGYGTKVWSGTGPFEVEIWTPGDRLTLKRTEKGSPPRERARLERVHIRVIPDPSARLAALESGQIDVDLVPEFKDIKRFEDRSDFQLSEIPGSTTTTFVFQTSRPPFNRREVRRAISLAIDRQALVDTFFYGHAEVGRSLFPSWHWAYDDASDVPYDPGQAKRLLAQAGHSNLKFTLMVGNLPLYTGQATAIQAQLKEIGVTMEIRPLEYTALSGIVTANDPSKWLGDAAMRRITPLSVTGYEFGYLQYGADGPLNNAMFNRPGGQQRPDIERMMLQALETSDGGDEGNAKAHPIWAKVAHELNEDPPQLVLNFANHVNIVRTDVRNWEPALANIVSLAPVTRGAA